MVMIFVMRSELDIVVVCQLQLLTDVLFPSRVQSHQLREEVSPHRALREVRNMEWLSVVVSFHSAAGSLNVLAVVLEHTVYLVVLLGNALPVSQDESQVQDCTNS